MELLEFLVLDSWWAIEKCHDFFIIISISMTLFLCLFPWLSMTRFKKMLFHDRGNHGMRACRALCDRRIKVHRTVVRPARLYGVEACAANTAQEKRVNFEEMWMLRWMCEVTQLYWIRNEGIRGIGKIEDISKKVKEKRLRRHRHVMRNMKDHLGKRWKEIKYYKGSEREEGWRRWWTMGEQISGRRDCRGRKCTTELHGGECFRKSTPT